MWVLIRKELLANLLTMRLAVAVVFTVVLAVLATIIGSVDYSGNVANYEQEHRRLATALDEATVYRNVQPNILVPPMPLSILSRGVVTTAAQWVGIEINYVPVGAFGQGTLDNRLMKVLVQIDFTTVVAILLSFLAVVLGFDGICGERERGTLGQLLTNPIPRARIVVAKLIGGVVSLWVPFALAFVISLLLALSNPDVRFTGEDWQRLVILFGLSCLFLSQIFAFSLMVSVLVRDTATSLIICLFAWLVGGIGFISVLPSVSRFGVDEPAADVFRAQDRELWGKFSSQMEAWENNHPRPAKPYMQVLDRGGTMRFGHPVGYRWRALRTEHEIDKRLERADRAYELQWANWKPLATEAYLVDEWSILSPFTNYQVLCYYLANTSIDDTFYLAGLGRDYRATWISYLRSKGAFASIRWFTDDPPDQVPMIADPESVTETMMAPDAPYLQARLAWANEQQQLLAQEGGRGLDLTDMPKFGTKWRRSLAESLAIMAPGLAVLILTTALAVMFTVVRFQRYDPR